MPFLLPLYFSLIARLCRYSQTNDSCFNIVGEIPRKIISFALYKKFFVSWRCSAGIGCICRFLNILVHNEENRLLVLVESLRILLIHIKDKKVKLLSGSLLITY